MPRLVLISAPAGFGKTTVLTQWLTSSPKIQACAPTGCRSVAWLSLDAADADLRRFLIHLIAALQSPVRRWASTRSRCWTHDGGIPPDAVLVSLVNDLDSAAGRRRGPGRLPRHRRARRPRRGHVPARQPAAARSPSPSRPAPIRRCRCPGCGLAASSSSFAPPTCGSPRTRPTPSSTSVMGLRPRPRRTSPRSRPGPRGGPPGSSWPPCRRAAAPARGRDGRRRRRFRRRVHRKPPVRPRLPGRGGAATRQPDERPGIPPRHLRARPADRRALCDAVTGQARRAADARDPRTGEPVRRPAGRPAALVPLPPPVRRRAARPAARPGPGPGSPSCTGLPPAGTPTTACWPTPLRHALAGGDVGSPPTSWSSACPQLQPAPPGPHAARLAPSRCPTTCSAGVPCWRPASPGPG